MKKKTKKYKHPVDMRSYGDILDISPGGYMDTRNNYGNLLTKLLSKKIIPTKQSKVKILCSDVAGNPNSPYRISITKIYSFGWLLRKWEYLYGEEFSILLFGEESQLASAKLQKEGERRSGWGAFSASSRHQNEEKEEIEFQRSLANLSDKKKEEVQKERKRVLSQRVNNLVIA
ncbi:MAG TPA: hypothetical protein PK950_00740 [Candidatus Paceibacterota bacterium]|nr:hypothetical protein [Candidatus Paceibacterota bacterium]